MRILPNSGELPERPIGHDWKSCVLARGPWVRIPHSPPPHLKVEDGIFRLRTVTFPGVSGHERYLNHLCGYFFKYVAKANLTVEVTSAMCRE